MPASTTMTSSSSSSRPVLRALLLAAGMLAAALPAVNAAASPLAWFSGDRVQGSGNVTRQTRQVEHFTALSLSMGGNVEVRLGATEGVTIEADDNLLPLIETSVENGTLRIRPAKRDLQLEPRTLKIIVQARTVERLTVAGSGTVTADGMHGRNLAFDVAGSGGIKAYHLDGESVSMSLGGSGTLQAGGKAERLQVSVGGSGKVQAGELAAREAMVSLSGSGQAQVWAKEALNVNVAGSGEVGYYGDPRLTRSVAGSGNVRRLGAAPQ
ncbi:head GIN domain-containing protein [Rugamonas fusca]|nr:head GIN domain-containing protein [Rugamonas fusca]